MKTGGMGNRGREKTDGERKRGEGKWGNEGSGETYREGKWGVWGNERSRETDGEGKRGEWEVGKRGRGITREKKKLRRGEGRKGKQREGGEKEGSKRNIDEEEKLKEIKCLVMKEFAIRIPRFNNIIYKT